jgi:phospholipid/cholesterol/gamma-HCH transport system ATP-binding protein
METILEFRDVSLETRHPYDIGLSAASFSLAPGELLIVEVEKGHGRTPLPDAAQGLAVPDRGAVLFRGRDWAAMTAAESAANRGKTGRVFETGGWLSNLNIDENITLSQRHHTLRPVEEIYAEAETAARAFGLNEVPKIRPAAAKRPERRAAEWVRAFIGEPVLIILEHPMNEAYTSSLPKLSGAAEKARAGGAAVLWLTYDSLPPAAGIKSARLARLSGDKLILR